MEKKVTEAEKKRIERSMKEGTAAIIAGAKPGKSHTLTHILDDMKRVYSPNEQGINLNDSE